MHVEGLCRGVWPARSAHLDARACKLRRRRRPPPRRGRGCFLLGGTARSEISIWVDELSIWVDDAREDDALERAKCLEAGTDGVALDVVLDDTQPSGARRLALSRAVARERRVGRIATLGLLQDEEAAHRRKVVELVEVVGVAA